MANNYSRQREAIKTYLRSTYSHPTAEEVYQALRVTCPKISLGTVYRNLALLAEKGELLRVTDCGNVDHFDAHTHPHAHFICRCCGSIQDLPAPYYEDLLFSAEKETNGKVERLSAYFYGLCSHCAAENS